MLLILLFKDIYIPLKCPWWTFSNGFNPKVGKVGKWQSGGIKENIIIKGMQLNKIYKESYWDSWVSWAMSEEPALLISLYLLIKKSTCQRNLLGLYAQTNLIVRPCSTFIPCHQNYHQSLKEFRLTFLLCQRMHFFFNPKTCGTSITTNRSWGCTWENSINVCWDTGKAHPHMRWITSSHVSHCQGCSFIHEAQKLCWVWTSCHPQRATWQTPIKLPTPRCELFIRKHGVGGVYLTRWGCVEQMQDNSQWSEPRHKHT